MISRDEKLILGIFIRYFVFFKIEELSAYESRRSEINRLQNLRDGKEINEGMQRNLFLKCNLNNEIDRNIKRRMPNLLYLGVRREQSIPWEDQNCYSSCMGNE